MSCVFVPLLSGVLPFFSRECSRDSRFKIVQESDPTSCMSIGHILEPAKLANRGHLF